MSKKTLVLLRKSKEMGSPKLPKNLGLVRKSKEMGSPKWPKNLGVTKEIKGNGVPKMAKKPWFYYGNQRKWGPQNGQKTLV